MGDLTHFPTPSDSGKAPPPANPVSLGYSPGTSGTPGTARRLAPDRWAMPARSPQLLADQLLVWVDRHRRWVFGILLLIYLAGFNAQWRLEPDSALYLSVGRNLADGRGYTFHGQAHRLAYPGLPLLFATTFKTLHTRSLVPALVLMLGMGLAALALTYRLILLAADRPTAVIVTTGVALSRMFYRYNFELLSDLPFLTGVLAFLVGYEALFHCRSRRKQRREVGAAVAGHNGSANGNANEIPNGNGSPNGHPLDDAGDAACCGRRRWFDWLLLVGGLATAVAMRPAMWALVLAVVAASAYGVLRTLVRRRGTRGTRGRWAPWGQLLIGAAVVGAVALFYLRDPRHAEPIFGGPPATVGPGYAEEDEMFNLRGARLRIMARHAWHSLPAFFDAVSKAAFGLPLDLGLFDGKWLFGGLILVLGAGLFFRRPLWGLLVLATVAMVLMVKPVDRYFLPLAPLLVFAWWRFCAAVNRRLPQHGVPPPCANAVFVLLFLFGAAPNFAKVVGFIHEQRRVPFLASYKEGRYASVYEAARMIDAHTPPSAGTDEKHATWVLVGPKFGRILTFLSDRYATDSGGQNNLDPARQPLYVLGSLRPDPHNAPNAPGGANEPGGTALIDPGIRAWLTQHHFHCDDDAVARVPHKESNVRGLWSALYRVRRDGDSATPPAPTAAPSQGKPTGP